jgi:hypothetical protein
MSSSFVAGTTIDAVSAQVKKVTHNLKDFHVVIETEKYEMAVIIYSNCYVGVIST